MFYITIFIQEKSLICCIGQLKQQTIDPLTQHHFNLDEGLLDDLILFVTKTINNSKSKMIGRIILSLDTIMKANLPLPQLNLMPYELDEYVKYSLPKLFLNQTSLAYDFSIENDILNQDSLQQLKVYAYPIKQIGFLIEHLPWHMNFIGIPLPSKTELTDYGSSFIDIATMIDITGINLLPWREQQRKNKRRYFYYLSMTIVVILFIITLTIYHLLSQALSYQIDITKQLQNRYLQTRTQLTELIELGKQNEQLELLLNQRLVTINHHKDMLTLLIILAEMIPNNMWLNEVEYTDYQLNIKGISLFYGDILSLVAQLNQLALIANSKILTIKKQQQQLNFQLIIQLNHINNEDN